MKLHRKKNPRKKLYAINAIHNTIVTFLSLPYQSYNYLQERQTIVGLKINNLINLIHNKKYINVYCCVILQSC